MQEQQRQYDSSEVLELADQQGEGPDDYGYTGPGKNGRDFTKSPMNKVRARNRVKNKAARKARRVNRKK